MAICLNNCFRFSGRLDLPAYPGFMVTKLPTWGLSLTYFPINSILFCLSLNPVWITKICWEQADNILYSNLLNSSKHPQAPTWHKPIKIRPIAWKSKVSSQLKTNTNRPSWAPKALTDSVLPVPAGPNGAPPILKCNACVNVKKHLSVKGVCTSFYPTPKYSNP